MADPLARISLGAIRVFEAGARLKSFTRAADELGLTQAAVSWQIKQLEARLGRGLFLRLPREVQLTPAGERLARASTEAMNRVRAALEELSEEEAGILAITCIQSFAAQWLAPRLGAFQLAHPKTAVRVETGAQMVDLVHASFDAGIRTGFGDWPGLTAVRLFTTAVAPIAAPSLIEKLGGFERPQDLIGAPRIGAGEDWAQWFDAAGVEPCSHEGFGPRLAADLQIFEVAAAIAGQGVALASPILFAADIAAGRLALASDVLLKSKRAYWLVYPEERARTPKIAAFRHWLLDHVAADPSVPVYDGSA